MSSAPSNDPLLQPFQLKHLRLKNRLMITAHEPAYPEDGMPKAKYRAYHVERAKAGIALTMTAGSAAVSRDSPPVFNNILAYKDEVVPWMRELTDACHEHGTAVMIQLTHLGRRTSWSKADWLPVVSPSHEREASHRAFPIIPCTLCGSQENLQRKQIGNMLRDWEKQYPGRIESMFTALQNVVPSHLMDTKRHDFQNIRTTGVPEPDGDTAFDAPELPAPSAPGGVQLVQL